MAKLTRRQIAEFIKADSTLRTFEQMQDAGEEAADAAGGTQIAPLPGTVAEDLGARIAVLERALLTPPAIERLPVDDVSPASLSAELAERIARLEQSVGLSLVPQPMPLVPHAPDGTYAAPTSISIIGGVITAIS